MLAVRNQFVGIASIQGSAFPYTSAITLTFFKSMMIRTGEQNGDLQGNFPLFPSHLGLLNTTYITTRSRVD